MSSRNINHTSRWYPTSFRVRYQETDQMGVVYHANYLNWFEIGRTEMLRELGFTYREMENGGVFLPVTSADLQFKSPARYDDLVVVFARLTNFAALRVVFEYEIRRLPKEGSLIPGELAGNAEQVEPLNPNSSSGELLVSGSTSHVWLNKDWKPTRLDRALPELFQGIIGALREEGGAV
ncbi:acyl-CoA thioesterase [Paenibacillus wynnii]|uniref:Thioesterase n=1 Tax=Paenibacillus wynnii TaxID=268407 RepID=A0A098M3X6_9BACL|nr:thioesterase family protein [Paenibacillus wynnii]KGE16287.1 thioesterase [Paenibacillus wynnii]